MNNNPIGVFDTGVGGLSCLGPIMERMPKESIIFFGDCLRAPYGDRPKEEIIAFTLEIADYLVGRGAKALVIACNTISCTAIDDIKKKYPGIPVIGIVEPAAEAISKMGEKEIIAISTEATARSGAYANAVGRRCGTRVIARGCSRFTPLIEAGKTGTAEAEEAVRFHMNDIFREGSLVVLGCTHYPFIAGDIRKVYPSARIFNPARALAEEVFVELEANDMLCSDSSIAGYELSASRLTGTFAKLAKDVMGDRPYEVSLHIL